MLKLDKFFDINSFGNLVSSVQAQAWILPEILGNRLLEKFQAHRKLLLKAMHFVANFVSQKVPFNSIGLILRKYVLFYNNNILLLNLPFVDILLLFPGLCRCKLSTYCSVTWWYYVIFSHEAIVYDNMIIHLNDEIITY